MAFVGDFIKGIFIGAGSILPGISSGVICIVLGIYEKLLNSILHFFKDFKKNLHFLFPIGLGGIFGCVLFGNILVYFFNNIPVQTKSLFMGLLLGSLYILYKKENNSVGAEFHLRPGRDGTLPLHGKISFIVCFLIGIGLIYLENQVTVSVDYTPNSFSSLFLILSGFLMSIGIVVPRCE